MRSIAVLDAAVLTRRGVVVLELDTPNPLVGVRVGMTVSLVFPDRSREALELRGLGFASSTPEHAHVIVSTPMRTSALVPSSLEVPELEP